MAYSSIDEQGDHMNKKYIEGYAKLVLAKGVNLRKGQSVMIKTGPGTYQFARELAKTAYRMGALHVEIALDDLDILAARLASQDAAQVQRSPSYARMIDYEMVSEDWAFIRIDSTEERLDHAPFDAESYARYQHAASIEHDTIQNKRMRHQLAWCVICAPGPRWAKQVLGDTATEDDLWDEIAPILLLDTQDPCKAWDEHDAIVKPRVAKLNGLGIRKLHFISPITDLKIGFRPEHVWKGGSKLLPDGRPNICNLPTEEIFTVPDMYDVEGHVTTTRPVPVMNTLTESVRFTFRKGQVVDCTAKQGMGVLERFLQIDAGSSRLGECALVDETSPIARSRKIFNSILFDENASCHLALGMGYPDSLANGGSLVSDEQLHQFGCNTSLNHTDFMVGSDDTDIVALCADGKEVRIMKNGRFCF